MDFGSYTLLIVQILFLVWCGVTINKLFRQQVKNLQFSLGRHVNILFVFGVYSALSFDYHSNVIAACVIPAFLLALSNNSLKIAWFWLLFILAGKENLSLWMIFVCIGLLVEYRKSKQVSYHLVAMVLVSIVWFVGVTGFIMPAFSENGAYPHFHYSVLGETSGDAIKFLLMHPIESLKLLFSNHTGLPEADHVKPEFIALMCYAGLPLLIFRPAYLIMMIPLVFQKFYHDDFFKWGIYAQYSIEFAPIVAIGVVSAVSGFNNNKFRLLILLVVIAGNLRATRYLFKEKTRLWQEKNKIDPFRMSHYRRPFPVEQFRKAIDLIPEDAIVSCQSNFQPHISLRDKVYQFPDINDAQFILLTDWAGSYPLERKDFDCWMDSLHRSDDWNIEYENVWVVLFGRKNSVAQ
ncbi:MAG: DUF2079 domain-containing protein [Bacteroidia bacterium]